MQVRDLKSLSVSVLEIGQTIIPFVQMITRHILVFLDDYANPFQRVNIEEQTTSRFMGHFKFYIAMDVCKNKVRRVCNRRVRVEVLQELDALVKEVFAGFAEGGSDLDEISF